MSLKYSRTLIAIALLLQGLATITASAQSQALVDAKKKLAAAQAALTDASNNLTAIKDKLKTDFLATPEVAPLVEESNKAKEAFEAAKAPVLEKVHGGADYQAALKAKNDANAKLQSMRAEKSATAEQFTEITKQVTAAQNKMDILESEAIKADPKVAEAQTLQTSTKKALDAKVSEFNSTLESNKDVEDAKAKIDEAKKDLADAKKQFAEAQKQDAAMRKNKQGGGSHGNKGGSGPGGGGPRGGGGY